MIGSEQLMPIVILAGGLATRLRPRTDGIPKSLVEVAGRPFLWHQLQMLKRQGIRRVVLAVGHLGEQIQNRFGDGLDLGITLEYSFDGLSPLGTAGAIRNALSRLPERFFVLYGDSYLTCDFRSVESAFHKSNQPGLMTVFRNDDRFDNSNVEFNGTRILRYDKRNRTPDVHHIDYGLGAFHRDVFAPLAAGEPYDLESVYQKLLSDGKLTAFEVHERFYEIGSPEGLLETDRYLSQREA
jgi:NDP-sugar pyrophosphorylase family protein